MAMQGSKKLPVVKLVDSLEASWVYVANEGTTFTLQTNYKAPRCRWVCSVAAVAVMHHDQMLLTGWEATCHGLALAADSDWGLAELRLPWQLGWGWQLALTMV